MFFDTIQAQYLYLPIDIKWVKLGDLDVTGDSITVEAIIMTVPKFSSIDIVSKHTSPADVNYLLRPSVFEITTDSGYYAVANTYILLPNIFYHVAATYDGQTVRYYVNGCETGNMHAAGNMQQNNLTTAIGQQSTSAMSGNPIEQFFGYIDEVRIWRTTRTQAQIEANMTNLPSPATQYGLVAYYQFTGNYKNMQGNSLWDGIPMGSPQLTSNNSSLPQPQPPIVIDSISVNNACYGLKDGHASVIAQGGSTPYSYSLDGITYQSGNNFSGLAPGNYIIYIKSVYGCSVQSSFTVAQTDSISIIINNDQKICDGDSVTISANATGGTGNYNYLWSNGYTGNSQIVSPSITTSYSVFAIDSTGCKSLYKYYIATVVDTCNVVFFPNAFTPNGDGKNDVFSISTTNTSEIQTFIFDRWGEQLYSWDTLTGGWDGMARGMKAQEDVYNVVVYYTDKELKKHTVTGIVTLLR